VCGMRTPILALLGLLVLAPFSWAGEANTKGPVYSRGTPYWTYEDAVLRMVASVTVDGARTLLVLTVSNVSKEEFTLAPEDLKLIYAGGDNVKKKDLIRIEPKDYVQAFKTNGALAGALMGIATYALTMGAPQTATFAVASPGSLSVGAIRVSPSPSDRASALSLSASVAEKMTSSALEKAERADEVVLRTTTLFPGDTVAGVIPFKFRALEGEEFLVLVRGPESVGRLTVRYETE
jgi:hypothetical protein